MNTNVVTVRAGRLEDAGTYRACVDRVARERTYLAITEAYPEAEVEVFVADLIARDLPFYVAANEGGRVVGWCDIHVAKAPRSGRGSRMWARLAWASTRSIGAAASAGRLLEAALDHARRIGLERVELQVFPENAPALALYRNLGFAEEGLRRRARKLDGRYQDLVQLALLLRPRG